MLSPELGKKTKKFFSQNGDCLKKKFVKRVGKSSFEKNAFKDLRKVAGSFYSHFVNRRLNRVTQTKMSVK